MSYSPIPDKVVMALKELETCPTFNVPYPAGKISVIACNHIYTVVYMYIHKHTRPTWWCCRKTHWQRDCLCTVSTQYLDGDRAESSQTHLSMFSTPKPRQVRLVHMLHYTRLLTIPDLDSSVPRCRHNVSVVKVHYINCRPMSHEYPAQYNVMRGTHVPYCYSPVLYDWS